LRSQPCDIAGARSGTSQTRASWGSFLSGSGISRANVGNEEGPVAGVDDDEEAGAAGSRGGLEGRAWLSSAEKCVVSITLLCSGVPSLSTCPVVV
jgi:hypothetical protein